MQAFLHVWVWTCVLRVVLNFILQCNRVDNRRELTLFFLIILGRISIILFRKTFLKSILSNVFNQAILNFQTITSFFRAKRIFWVNFFFIFYYTFLSTFLLKHFNYGIHLCWIIVEFIEWFLFYFVNIRFINPYFILVLKTRFTWKLFDLGWTL